MKTHFALLAAALTFGLAAQSQTKAPQQLKLTPQQLEQMRRFAAEHPIPSGVQKVTPQAAPKLAPIVWRTSLVAARREAKRTGKPLVVDYMASWCGACHLMDDKVFPDAKVVAVFKDWVPVRVQLSDDQEVVLKQKTLPPLLRFYKSNGRKIGEFGGVLSPRELVALMKTNYAKR